MDGTEVEVCTNAAGLFEIPLAPGGHTVRLPCLPDPEEGVPQREPCRCESQVEVRAGETAFVTCGGLTVLID